eukprot:Ihof_evm1s363 gene=Ihof_evmTU1s363
MSFYSDEPVFPLGSREGASRPRDHHVQHPRQQLVNYMTRLYDEKLTTLSGGNLSIMDSDGTLWMTPGGVDKGRLREDQIVWLRAGGSKWEGGAKVSMESALHTAVYSGQPQYRAVVHSHSPSIIAFAVAYKRPTYSYLWQASDVCGRIAMVDYALPGSSDLARMTGKAFRKGSRCIILANHGAVVAGMDLDDAFCTLATLETFATTMLRAISLGRIPTPPDIANPRPSDEPHWWSEDAWEYKEGIEGLEEGAMSSREREQRQKLADYVRRGYKQQLFGPLSGSVSLRLDEHSVLITPTGIDRYTMQPQDMVKVYFLDVCINQRFLGKAACSDTGYCPSRAISHHVAIYQSNPDINAIITAHPVNIGAHCMSHKNIDPNIMAETIVVAGSKIAMLPLYKTNIAQNIAAALRGKNTGRSHAVMMCNDAITVVGITMLQ